MDYYFDDWCLQNYNTTNNENVGGKFENSNVEKSRLIQTEENKEIVGNLNIHITHSATNWQFRPNMSKTKLLHFSK